MVERFRHYNQHWLDMVERDTMMEDSGVISPYMYGIDNDDYLPHGLMLEQSLGEDDAYNEGDYITTEHWDATMRPGTPAAFLAQDSLAGNYDMGQADLLGEPGWPAWPGGDVAAQVSPPDGGFLDSGPPTYRVSDFGSR